MVTARPHLFSILGIALLVATAGLHLPAMTGGSLPQPVLGNHLDSLDPPCRPGATNRTCLARIIHEASILVNNAPAGAA